jgi:hypothetical protein
VAPKGLDVSVLAWNKPRLLFSGEGDELCGVLRKASRVLREAGAPSPGVEPGGGCACHAASVTARARAVRPPRIP